MPVRQREQLASWRHGGSPAVLCFWPQGLELELRVPSQEGVHLLRALVILDAAYAARVQGQQGGTSLPAVHLCRFSGASGPCKRQAPLQRVPAHARLSHQHQYIHQHAARPHQQRSSIKKFRLEGLQGTRATHARSRASRARAACALYMVPHHAPPSNDTLAANSPSAAPRPPRSCATACPRAWPAPRCPSTARPAAPGRTAQQHAAPAAAWLPRCPR